MRVNGYKNVVVERKAVSNKTGKATFIGTSIGGFLNNSRGKRSVEVDTIRLDDYFKNFGKIDFIKMDIEGAEYAALQGMSNLIKKNKNLKIITEFFPMTLKRFGSSPEVFLNALIKHGFKLYNINEKKEKIEPITVGELIQMCSGGKHTNLLCLRKPLR